MLGFIVDGPGDFAAFRARFKNTCRILKADGPRGHTVDPKKIIDAAQKQIEMLRTFGCRAVVIVTDFEERTIPWKRFVNELNEAIVSRNVDLKISVASPNRMLENWYLADVENVAKKHVFLRKPVRQRKFEGVDGKEVLKRLFVSRITYNEVTHGPQIFPLVREDIAVTNSESFDAFVRILKSEGVHVALKK